tara:strand:- start:2554 stop:3255 length:702 start_codon:yes stop_codon:yes gene_type:complete
MIKLQEIVGLPTLQYHLDNKLTLSECIYRYSSDSFVQLFAEARQALRDGKIQLNEQDVDLLENTDIGEYGLFEGVKVPLDLPMLNEGQHEMVCKKCSHDWTPQPRDPHPALCHNCGYDNEKGAYDMKALEDWKALNEADYHGKNVELGKPKRGGSKKFVVYVKDPKTKKVKKVQFGDSGNLKVKIDDPKARHAFAARHKCAQEKNRLSANYWGCRIGRYWKSLGGSKNFSGYW